MSEKPLLEITHLSVDFISDGEVFSAVKDISFDLYKGEILAIVGESGSGKSVTTQAITRLLPGEKKCKIIGSAKLNGTELLKLSEKKLQKVRGKEIAYIFQDPASSLNPVYTIGSQIEEVLKIHQKHLKTKKERILCIEKALLDVGINPILRSAYPHEFSGGMQQRVMIAMALACQPKILVADEPTTALDVSVQKQIIELLLKIKQERQMSIILISHNLALVAQIADRISIFYKGEKIEEGKTSDVVYSPKNEYTKHLICSIPKLT